MKEACRICARELCGNQRRWIFHPAARISLQVLLSHVLGHELGRDGRGEFACSKCVFMLERMFRFDTVIARVEVLSLERLQKLLLERDRLRQCVGGLYRKNNPEDGDPGPAGPALRVVGPEDSAGLDLDLQEARYSDLIQDDLTYSVHESWADSELLVPEQHQHLLPGPESRTRRCRGCAALRVADSDYEAVCKVPRRVGRRSTSCGPSTRYSATSPGAQDLVQTSDTTDFPLESSSAALDPGKSTCGETGMSPSPASSVESLDTTVDISGPPGDHEEDHQKDPEEKKSQSESSQLFREFSPEAVLGLLRGCEYRPIRLQGGSRIPVLLRAKPDQGLAPRGSGSADLVLPPQQGPVLRQDLQAELLEIQEDWMDQYVTFDLRQEQQLVTSDLSPVLKVSPLHVCHRGNSLQAADADLMKSSSSSSSVSDWSSWLVFQRQVEEQSDHLRGFQTAQEQVRSLQARIRQSEARNQVQPRLSQPP